MKYLYEKDSYFLESTKYNLSPYSIAVTFKDSVSVSILSDRERGGMKRRKFLIWSSLLGLSSSLKATNSDDFEKSFQTVEAVIRAVQEHMFPEGSYLPSAREMQTTRFLFETISHKTYDKEIRAFVIEGAKELQRREKGKFASMGEEEKENALRAYEESSDGANWLARIMTLTMEGMFGDPVYGSNIQESGWTALHTSGGNPRPKNRYIEG